MIQPQNGGVGHLSRTDVHFRPAQLLHLPEILTSLVNRHSVFDGHLLRAALFDHQLAELDEQAGETGKGAGRPPGMSGMGLNCCGPVRG